MRFFFFAIATILIACQSTDQKSPTPPVSPAITQEQSKSTQDKIPKATPPPRAKVKVNNQLRAAVKENGSWDYIRQDGSKVTTQKFTWADNYSCGKACVSKTGKWVNGMIYGAIYYFIDKDGNPGKLKFYDQARYHEERAVIIDMDNKMMLIDLDENIIVSGFDQIGRISEGLAYATKGNITGYINKKGQWKFQVEKGTILSQFQEGLAMAKKDGKSGYINKEGAWQIEPTWDAAMLFKDGRAVVKNDEILSLIDNNGSIIAELDGDYVAGFSEGLCGLRKSGKWGFIDMNGDIVVDIKYDGCRMFSDGYAAVLLENKAGFIDKTGKMIIEPQFNSVYSFKNGLAMAADDKTLGYINISGEFVISPKYERVNYFEDMDDTNLIFRAQ